MEGSVCSWFQHNLDAAVLLVAEGLVHLGSPFKGLGVGNDERRIDLIFEDAVEEIVGPSVHMGLPGADGQSLVHHRTHWKLVEQATVDAWYRKDAGGSADIHHFPEDVRT